MEIHEILFDIRKKFVDFTNPREMCPCPWRHLSLKHGNISVDHKNRVGYVRTFKPSINLITAHKNPLEYETFTKTTVAAALH